jgi:hypothetical protein
VRLPRSNPCVGGEAFVLLNSPNIYVPKVNPDMHGWGPCVLPWAVLSQWNKREPRKFPIGILIRRFQMTEKGRPWLPCQGLCQGSRGDLNAVCSGSEWGTHSAATSERNIWSQSAFLLGEFTPGPPPWQCSPQATAKLESQLLVPEADPTHFSPP